jgi:hypothetical protein
MTDNKGTTKPKYLTPKEWTEQKTTAYPGRLRRNRSNLGFQSATGRIRRGEPDRSCRLPSLLIRDQAGCPFDETGKMPVLPVTRPYEKFAQGAKISIDSSTDDIDRLRH